MSNKSEFLTGLRDGIPIMLGYFAVSFSLGIIAVNSGFTVLSSAILSMMNMTSAGEFAAVNIVAVGGSVIELFLTTVIINLRYALMSLSLSQKLENGMPLWKRCIIAFGNTDEIFAVAINRAKAITLAYFVGLELLPIIGWTAGTAIGAAAGNILPKAITGALGIALYGMFIAIVAPCAKKSKAIATVVSIALVLSCVFYYVPVINKVSTGISIVICTVVAAAIGAVAFPVDESKGETQ